MWTSFPRFAGNAPVDAPLSHAPRAADKTPYAHLFENADAFEQQRSGLSERLSSQIFETQAEILEAKKGYPNAEGLQGDFPDEWLDRVSAQNRALFKQTLAEAFKAAASQIRQDYHGVVQSIAEPFPINLLHIKNPRPITLDIRLGRLLCSANPMAAKPLRFECQRAWQGSYATVHRFLVQGKPYALKLFKHPVNHLEGTEDVHGSPIEPNRAGALKRLQPLNQFPYFYFADLEAGYQVMEWVAEDSDNGVPSYQPISLQSLGLRHADLENETNLSRSGRIYDYGGIIVKQTEIARQQAEVDAALASGLRRWSRSPRAPRLPLPGRKPPGSVFAEERHQAAAKPPASPVTAFPAHTGSADKHPWPDLAPSPPALATTQPETLPKAKRPKTAFPLAAANAPLTPLLMGEAVQRFNNDGSHQNNKQRREDK